MSDPEPASNLADADDSPDGTRALLESLLVRGVSEALVQIEATERQVNFGEALYQALAARGEQPTAPWPGCIPPPQYGLPRPDPCWRNRRMRRSMLEGARWLATTPWTAEERARWLSGRGDGQRRHARRSDE